MRSIVALSIVAVLLPVSVVAQDAVRAPEMRMLGARSSEVVLGQPYTVVEKMTTTEPLANGTTITRVHEERKWRDAQGRFRTETAEVPSSGEVVFHHAEIFDPMTRTMTILDLDKKVAMVAHMPEREGRPHTAEVAAEDRGPMARPGVQVTTEQLPGKTFAGVYATGTRVTRVRPVGTVGNDKPLVSTSDRYDSPELKILLYSSMDDPREKMVREVTSIERGDPDASLFQAPADFSVKELPARHPRQ